MTLLLSAVSCVMLFFLCVKMGVFKNPFKKDTHA